jgi:hypothetical protein
MWTFSINSILLQKNYIFICKFSFCWKLYNNFFLPTIFLFCSETE